MALEAVSGQRTPEWVKGALDGCCREQADQEARRHLPRARSESWELKRACFWLLLHLKFTIRQRQSDKQCSKDLTCLSVTFCVMKFCLLKNAGPGEQARTVAHIQILPHVLFPRFLCTWCTPNQALCSPAVRAATLPGRSQPPSVH